MATDADQSSLPILLNPGKESTPTSAITLAHSASPSPLMDPDMESAGLPSSTTPAKGGTADASATSRQQEAEHEHQTPRNPTHALVHDAPTAQAEQHFSAALDSPCFVHSYLDKGVTLGDSLKKQRRRLSKDAKARQKPARARHAARRRSAADSESQEAATSSSSASRDVDQTPRPQASVGSEASYFDPATYDRMPSSSDATGSGSSSGRHRDEIDEDSQTSRNATTTARGYGKRDAARPGPNEGNGQNDLGGELSDAHSSSYDSSYENGSGEDDDKVRSLTHQLAETAVGVREMSKQLGRARVKSTIHSVLIITKARDNQLIKLTRELAIWLMTTPRNGKDAGLTVYVDSQLRESKRFDADGIKRDYPKLFDTRPRRTASMSSSMSSISGYESGSGFPRQEGKLRYWTSDMCSRSPHLFDFVVTLGGDGTVLFCSWLFQRIVPPVLPFSLGSLGFLTNFDFARYKEVMTSALDDGIRVNLRMRFTATIYRATLPSSSSADRYRRRAIKSGKTGEIIMRNIKDCGWDAIESPTPSSGERPRAYDGGGTSGNNAGGKDARAARDSPGKAEEGKKAKKKKKNRQKCKDKEVMCFSTRPVETFEVLNDLVVDRGPSPYVSLLEVFGDEHHMTTAQADGLCISTPTGSTAYSLSAGGSLVHPEIPAILISPICPHTLSFRPMLLPDSMELRIAVPYNSRSTAWASFDGRGRVELKQGDHIKVTASRYPFPTVCAENQSTDWFSSISRTLKWNERQRQKSFVVVEEGNESAEGSQGSNSKNSEGVTFAKHAADDDSDDDDDDEDDDGDDDGDDDEDDDNDDDDDDADEDNEDDEDETEDFDIDDTSTTATRSNSPNHSAANTSGGGEAHQSRTRLGLERSKSSSSTSRRSSGQGILPTNANGVPRLTPFTSANQDMSKNKSSSMLNSPDRFGVQGPPLPPKALSQRHLLNADFRLDDDRSQSSKQQARTGTDRGEPTLRAHRSPRRDPMTPSSALMRDKTPTGLPEAGQRSRGSRQGKDDQETSTQPEHHLTSTGTGDQHENDRGAGTSPFVYGHDASDSDSTQGA